MGKLFVSTETLRIVASELPSEPRNHGMTWTSHSGANLAADFRMGHGLRRLCITFGRTPDSVIAKLRNANLITYNPVESAYFYADPDIQPKPETQPETKLENDMTQPLQNLTLIFGQDIKALTEPQLITAITKCTAEINSFSVIPRNKWTDKRTAELQDAITAAIAELDTRA